MIKSKNSSQHTTPHTGGTTRASAVTKRRHDTRTPRQDLRPLLFYAFNINVTNQVY
jgi:hypothetical protein